MDIDTVTSWRSARSRADLALAPGEAFIAGGTWSMSEPQPAVTGFVDLTTMGWPDLLVTRGGLQIGATCTIARLSGWARDEAPAGWPASAIIPDAADALLQSFKIQLVATVGGNLARGFTAAAMTSLAVALDGVAVVWTPEGGERRQRVAEFATGEGTTTLARGEVLRAIELPAAALRGRAALRKIALAELGRSGAVVTGRVDPSGEAVFGITASVTRPVVLRYPALPSADALAADVAAASGWHSDPLGPADWRRAVSVELSRRVRGDLLSHARSGVGGPKDGPDPVRPHDDGSPFEGGRRGSTL